MHSILALETQNVSEEACGSERHSLVERAGFHSQWICEKQTQEHILTLISILHVYPCLIPLQELKATSVVFPSDDKVKSVTINKVQCSLRDQFTKRF